MHPLTPTELEQTLKHIPEWQLEDGALVRSWSFKDFLEAMAFVNRVAVEAELAGHHPDIDVRYNRVRLALVTHDAGGITVRDSRLAQRINEL